MFIPVDLSFTSFRLLAYPSVFVNCYYPSSPPISPQPPPLVSVCPVSIYVNNNHQLTNPSLPPLCIPLTRTPLQMPIMDGIESTERYRRFEDEQENERSVKEKKTKRQLLIIGMSANSDAESKAEALRAGMTYFISKPFQYAKFVKILLRHEMDVV